MSDLNPDDLRLVAERLVSHIDEKVPTVRCSDAYPMTPLAGLVRCRSFLRSMLSHEREGLHDLMGADLRLLYETLVYSQYALFGADDAMERLRKHEIRQRSVIAQEADWDLTLAEPEEGTDDRLTFKEMCRLVGELLGERGSGFSTLFSDAYNTLYRSESYLGVHPSLQGLGLYMHEDGEGHAVGLTRPTDVEIADSRILMGAILVGHLAHDVFKDVGLDTSFIDETGEALGDFQPLMRNPPDELG